MKANICQVCGGKLKNFGTYFRCENCDTEYRIDESLSQDDMDAYFRRLNDFEDAERNLDVMPPHFDDAESEFERIIRKYPDWSAGYWGLVRSKFGIKFENDLDGKAVPSCYKSTYEDFCDTDEYNMAVELAETEELRQSYIKWAEYIARVTKEWRQTAQKYDYDVFISFKASEDSDGHETRDAREMHKLYDLIRDKGYRVFFSPVTLVAEGVAGKGSEPYIFNALDKSRALIVYGSKKEYFTSTWVQNEWQRYLRLIKEGKKEKGSLLVLYQGFNPKELPQGLRRIQGIEYGISAWPAVSSALEDILHKGKNEKAAAEEAARKAEEARKAEDEKRKKDEESANKLRDMLAQFAQMQAELARLKTEGRAISSQSIPAFQKEPENLKKELAESEGIVAPQFLSVVKAYGLHHRRNNDDFIIENGILTKYEGDDDCPIIPEGIKGIGEKAFLNSWLHSIVIPDGTEYIGVKAFSGCHFLSNIVIPCSVKKIGEGAFKGCANLKDIKIDLKNEAYYCSGDCLIEVATKTLIHGGDSGLIPAKGEIISIGAWAFSGNRIITEISIPQGVNVIGDGAFYGCSSLENVFISNGVTRIGNEAFSGCSNLASIILPNSLISIGVKAFESCEGLMDLNIPIEVIQIAEGAFDNCINLYLTVEEGNNFYYCKDNCLIETATKTLIRGDEFGKIPEDGSVERIGSGAFSGYESIVDEMIPNSVISIGNNAFSSCCELIKIFISENVKRIGTDVFDGCDNLSEIDVAGNNRFYHSAGNCLIETATKTIVRGTNNSLIPTDGSVTHIARHAFFWCADIESVNIPNSIISIDEGAFSWCCGIKEIVLPDGIIFIGDKAFEECHELKRINIPDGVKRIGSDTFNGCIKLSEITLSNHLISIGDRAFSNCQELASIVIPKSVIDIGDYVFTNCKNLKSITFPKNISYINRGMFDGCLKLKKIRIAKETQLNERVFDGLDDLQIVKY